jgi:bifunctional UDP-N-acetylglucosamine pyrophosphorylase/glucosamine-1-phosphate N-acetyltransferase
VKNSSLADGVRARHHSYIGDATLGKNADIGAGAITANFDGKKINSTKIGDNVFIGSGSVLIAPIDIPAGTKIKPGSAVTAENIEENKI